jgi:hypothetical protein
MRAAPGAELADGSVCVGRLLILASGMSGRLPQELGIKKRMVKEELSMAFGFMLGRTDGQAFPFDAVTYYTGTLADKVVTSPYSG